MNSKILIAGLALFTMFFGAGNITIPLMLVQLWPNDILAVFCGFCISAVFLIMLGLAGGVLAKNASNFFAPLGLVFGFVLQVVLMLIEGPFGVVPRCLIVSFGGIKELFSSAMPLAYYAVAAAGIYYIAVSKLVLVEGIGKYLTTAMLLALSIIVGITIYQYGFGAVRHVGGAINKHAFYDGVAKGYLTYDLPGAIYFSTIAMYYFARLGHNNQQMISNGLKASLICSVLLIVVYAAFFYLGASHIADIKNILPEQILLSIVKKSGGRGFAYVFVTFVVLACLTTAMAAITIWTDFICDTFKKYNPKYKYVLIPSLGIAVMVSMLKFTGLVKMLSPVLNVIYPILILLTFYNIFIRIKQAAQKQ